ncbi:PAS domain-containing sensor histidine kinase [Pseudoteredinibacter isoporae]|uniref:histidine kinase n=1 Tax=Pseudoteredinibacter isoporae TaxID=570281 RepID=A0A7X0MWM4_9GAMM|nr:PAS domain S-box protein [Pseudoteredinibacter isoporae]MBB6522633.1 two-component system sensor kinase FixL [Pseudoteredinibacter isoporae]NHO88163.1 PAS domain S-box protein [Pseudoteredinibacter isoporae]NIB23506.1 PAS domain S-box protein [Pseudoteredinibacter isoporae]
MDSLEPASNLLEYNEARYRILAEQSGVMITLHRPGDWAYTAVNPAVEQLTGYRADELLGLPAYELFHPEDAWAMQHKLIPAIKKHGTRTFRYRSRNRQGLYRWVESTHRSIRDEQSGELKEIIAVTREVQQEVEAEQALQRLAAVVEASADLVLLCDEQLQVLDLNRAARQALERPETDSESGERFSLRDYLSTESVQKIRTIALQVARQKGRWQGAIRLNLPEGKDGVWQLEQLIATNTEPVYGLYSLIIRDRSEEHAVQQALQDKQQQLAHSERLMSLGEMASGLAHEINQPLASLLNYARGGLRKLKQKEDLAPQQLSQLLTAMEKQAERAAAIVQQLRSMVKKTPHRPEIIELGQSLREAVNFVEQELEQQMVDIRWQEPNGKALVMADKVQLQQVWVNLLINALEAMAQASERRGSAKSGREIKISIRESLIPETQSSDWQVEICDQGAGISVDRMTQIFEPYYSSKSSGLGLGLSISRSIIESLGGGIDVDSDGKSYSCVKVRLAACREVQER